MPKAKKEIVIEKTEAEVKTPTYKVNLITNDFGREDLNELRDRLNEVIKLLK